MQIKLNSIASAASREIVCVNALVFSVLFAACSYGHGPPQIVAGRPFHEDRVEQVRAEMSVSAVRELLGEPYEVKNESGDAEIWRYLVESTQRESISFLGFIPLPDKTERSRSEVLIAFVGGRVDSVKIIE